MNKKQYLYSNLFAWGVVLLLIGNYVFGWTTPTQDPPGGNITPSFSQWSSSGSDIYYNDGNVGIGTSTPGAKLEVVGQLKITGGTPGDNKVLTSDASGVASWQTPAGGSLWTQTGDNIYYNTGNVGIGTAEPVANLHILSSSVRDESLLSSDSFETDFGNWPNAAGNTSDWQRISGGTPTSNTGPSSAYDGSYYIYVETSDGYSTISGNTDIVENNLGSSTNGCVDFYYHQYGTNQGTLYLEGYDGAAWNLIWSSSGNQGNQWNHVTCPTTDFTGCSKLRFRNVAAGGWYGDVALDLIKVYEVAYSATSDFVVKDSGNVGIGTTSPGTKLEVNGNIIASTPTADGHVATKGYVDAVGIPSGMVAIFLSTTCPTGWTRLVQLFRSDSKYTLSNVSGQYVGVTGGCTCGSFTFSWCKKN